MHIFLQLKFFWGDVHSQAQKGISAFFSQLRKYFVFLHVFKILK